MAKKPSGLTPRQKMELKKGKGKKGITLKGDAGVKKLMGGGTTRRRPMMMAKSGKSVTIKGLTPAQKRNLKAGKGKKGITLKADSGVKKLRRGGKV